jgi:hypothetical protein
MMEMTNDSDYWDPDLLSQSLLGIWFAASHQPWMFLDFVLLELCARQDAQRSLQEELESHAPYNYQELEKLPLLDSFIKETIRLNPLDKCKRIPRNRWSTSQSLTHAPNSCNSPESARAIHILEWIAFRATERYSMRVGIRSDA